LFYKIKLKPLNRNNKLVFRIILQKVLSKGKFKQQEVLGFYDTDFLKKKIVINSYRLGY